MPSFDQPCFVLCWGFVLPNGSLASQYSQRHIEVDLVEEGSAVGVEEVDPIGLERYSACGIETSAEFQVRLNFEIFYRSNQVLEDDTELDFVV